MTSYRVSQLAWLIKWENHSLESDENLTLTITYCEAERGYRILSGSEILKKAIKENREFIDATFIQDPSVTL